MRLMKHDFNVTEHDWSWTMTKTWLKRDWNVTETWLERDWNVTERDWNVTETWLKRDWNVTESWHKRGNVT